MTPAARIQTAIALLDSLVRDNRPADLAVRRFLRSRRYIGSKDRRAITDLVFRTVRSQIRLDWRIDKAGGRVNSRTRILAALVPSCSAPEITALFDSSNYGPTNLDVDEQRLLAAMVDEMSLDVRAPMHVRGNFPAWLETALIDQFGVAIETEMAALDRPASVDLRVNLARCSRRAALTALHKRGLDAEPTPFSPAGIRLSGRPRLTDHPLVREGLVILQDEGAQVAAYLVAPKIDAPRVLDFCAGAGGKSLALADIMAPITATARRLVACDVDLGRLKRLRRRARTAAIDWLEIHEIAKSNRAWLTSQADKFDRVLVDAPCSGTGTWRRHPDARQRLTPDILELYQHQQATILRRASQFVAPGGWLIYVTCSVLPSENRDQIDQFLENSRDFSALPVTSVWHDVFSTDCPTDQSTLQLTPYRHGVDGFYVGILRRDHFPSGS